MRRRAMSIRAKVLGLSLMLFALPWFGYQFVREMEGYLREGLEQSVMGAARALAGALDDRPGLFPDYAGGELGVIYAQPLPGPLQVDGYAGDWGKLVERMSVLGPDSLVQGTWDPASLGVSWLAASHGGYLYLLFRVHDDHVVYASPQPTGEAGDGDHLELLATDAGGHLHRYVLATISPGWVTAEELPDGPLAPGGRRPELRIRAEWQPVRGGYQIEARIPFTLLGGRRLGFEVYDVDSPHENAPVRVLASAPARGTATLVLPSPAIKRLIASLGRTPGRRIRVLDRRGLVLALGGSLDSGATPAPVNPLVALLLPPPDAEMLADLPAASRLSGPFLEAALAGHARTRWQSTRQSDVYVVSAIHPVWNGARVVGAVLVEDTSSGILSLRRRALASLSDITLLVGLGGGIALLIFASRISSRLRRLRREVELAIDTHGRVIGALDARQAGDEIGDVARGFAAMLERLRQYNHYLENLARRLSHELRTPIAVVRSSLDSLALDPDPARAATYLGRAREGLARLDTIITRMSEATRLERTLEGCERELFALDQVVASTVEGYRSAWPRRRFEFAAPPGELRVWGAPDLLVQALDKLVANAVDFGAQQQPVRIALVRMDGVARLSVTDVGPILPREMEARLFESMVSVRPHEQGGEPHLGLGLHIVRLIAEFHGGAARGFNLADGSGVCFEIDLPVLPVEPRPQRGRTGARR